MLVKTKGSVENLVFSGTALCCNIVFFLTFRAHHDRNWNSWFNWHDFIFCPKFNFLYFHKFLVKLNEKCGFCRQIYFLFISFYGTSNNRVWLDFHSFFTLLRQTNLKTYLSQWWLPAPFKLLNKTSESAFWTAKIPFGRLCRFWLKIYTFLSYWYENPNPKSMKITTKRQRQRGVTVSITFLKQPGHWSDIIRANWKERINDCFQRWIRWNRQMVPHLLDSYHGYHSHGTRKVPVNYSVGRYVDQHHF